MKKIDLGQTIGIIANVGVLAGLLLLAFELNQNRDLVQAQARHEVSQGVIDQFFGAASDGEFSELIRKGTSGDLESDAERFRYGMFLLARFRYWEDVHYQYRMGLFDETEFSATKVGWGRLLRYGATQDYWRTFRSDYSPEFVAEIDGIVAGLKVSE